MLTASSCAISPSVSEPASEDRTSSSAQSLSANASFDALAESFPAVNGVVLQNGQVIWSRTGGFDRDARDGLTQNYNFYSIAKMITGTAFYRLEANGRIDLDASIAQIDPTLDAKFADVTVRHLLGHMSGIRHYRGEQDWKSFNDKRCETPADSLAHFIEDDLVSAPGEKQSYSTYGFVLLSHLLMKITETDSFDAAMGDALGSAYTFTTDHDDASKAANLHKFADEFETVEINAQCKFGGGGLLGSARDLADFGSELIEGLIDPTDLAAWRLNNGDLINGAYGMGTGFDVDIQAHYAAHSGGSPGGRAFLLVLFEPKIVVVLTANSDGPNHGDTALEIGKLFAE